MYSKKVMDHFRHPRNLGKIEKADGIGKVGNIYCGDVMFLYIKLDKAKKRISDIKFETFGCASAIATSSMITELAKGRTIEKALKIGRKDVADSLGGLPPLKLHCSNLAADALHESIYDYLSKNKMKIPPELKKEHGRIKHDIETIEYRHKGHSE